MAFPSPGRKILGFKPRNSEEARHQGFPASDPLDVFVRGTKNFGGNTKTPRRIPKKAVGASDPLAVPKTAREFGQPKTQKRSQKGCQETGSPRVFRHIVSCFCGQPLCFRVPNRRPKTQKPSQNSKKIGPQREPKMQIFDFNRILIF
jgi:hypothetical protein